MQDILIVGSDMTYGEYLLESIGADPLANSLDLPSRLKLFNEGRDKRTNYALAERYINERARDVNLVMVFDHYNVESTVRGFIAAVRTSAKPDIPVLSCSSLSLYDQWSILSKDGIPERVYAFEKVIAETGVRAHDLALILEEYMTRRGGSWIHG